MSKIAERIKIALDIRNMKQSNLVILTGIGKSSISTYISGEYEPKQRNLYKLARALDVSVEWLVGLEDTMRKKENYNELIDRMIYIKDHFDLSRSDKDTINEACNILEEAMRNEQN